MTIISEILAAKQNCFNGFRANVNSLAVLVMQFDQKSKKFVAKTDFVEKAPINEGAIKIGAMMAPSILLDHVDPAKRIIVDRVKRGATNMVAIDFQSAIRAGITPTTLSGKFREFYIVGEGSHAAVYVKDAQTSFDGKAALFTTTEGKSCRRNMRELAAKGFPVKKFVAGASYAGASGLKDGKLYFLSVPLNEWRLHLNGVTSGAYNALVADGRNGISAGAVSKTAVRFGGRTASELPSHRSFQCVALYLGEFGKEGSLDGEFFFKANGWAPVGSTTHDRTFTIKGQGVAVSAKSLQTMILSLDDSPIRVDVSEVAAIFKGAKEGTTQYSGRVIYFGNGKPELLADFNAVKTIGDFTKWNQQVQEVYGDVDDKKDGTMNLSCQVISKLLGADLEAAIAFIQKKAKEFCVSAFKTPEAHDSLPSKRALEDGFRRAQNTVDLDPEAGLKYGEFFLNDLEQRKIHVAKRIHDLKIPMAGYMRVAMGDIATMFGEYILRPDEIVCPSIEEDKGVMVKYPSAAFLERVIVNVISVSDYLARAAQVLTAEQYEVVEELVLNMRSRLVMVSGYEILRKMLAGFDFDTDELFICTEPEVLRIFKAQGQGLAVLIDPSKSAAKKNPMKYHCDSTVFYESVMNTLNMGPSAIVGCVVNFFTMWQRIYIEGSYEDARNILANVYKNKGKGTNNYAPVFHVFHDDEFDIDCVNVDAEIMDQMWNQLPKMSLSTESIKAFLEDINVAAGRFSSEICIDIIKKTYQLRIPGMDRLLSATADYSFCFGAGGSGKRVVSLNNRLFKPLDAIIEATYQAAVDEIVERGLDLPIDVSDECVAAWEALSQDQRNTIVKLFDDYGALKAAYQNLKSDPELVKDLFQAWEGQFRMFTDNLKPMQRIQVLFGAYLKQDTRMDVTKNIGMILLPEWYAFVAYYSNRDNAMLAVVDADLPMTTDIKTRFVRSTMDISMVNTMRNIARRVRGKDRYNDVWSVKQTSDTAFGLFCNGDKVVQKDTRQQLFVSVGKSKTTQAEAIKSALNGFAGKAVYAQVTTSKNTWASLLLILRDEGATEAPHFAF